jgi:hypothetical protein
VTGIAVAGALTTALLALLLARGGGGQSRAMPIAAMTPPVASRVAPVIIPAVAAPPTPVEVAAPIPTEPAAAEEAPAPSARGKRRGHPRREHDRIARGLSIDPFAEAAARKHAR